MLSVKLIPVLQDNYIFVISFSNKAIVVDPAQSHPVDDYLQSNKLTLLKILITHHHHDHVGGIQELKNKYNCDVIGPEKERIPHSTQSVKDGDGIYFQNYTFQVISIPGHTLGHIAFYEATHKILFCGDTLFGMGCGRIFEGTATQMWSSLKKISNLPKETKIYCAHEYTLENSNFAMHIEPKNLDLLKRIHKIKNMRDRKEPTIPFTLEEELNTNPFLRAHRPEVQAKLNLEGETSVNVFSHLRSMRNQF